MVVIVNEEEFLQKIIKALNDKCQIEIPSLQCNEVSEWLELKQAQLILPYKSKKKWKELRDCNAIDFSIHGRRYLYYRESLLKYISKNSTLISLSKRKV